MTTRVRTALSYTLLVGCLLACDDPQTSAASGDHHGSAGQAGAAGDGGQPDDDFVGCPDGTPSVVAGLEASGKLLAVHVVGGMPSQLERYINDWTVELRSLDGAPARAAQIVRAQTFMPLHGHDGGVVPRLTPLAEPGQVRVERLNFIMRGPWEVRLWLRSASGEEDYVVFQVCVAK